MKKSRLFFEPTGQSDGNEYLWRRKGEGCVVEDGGITSMKEWPPLHLKKNDVINDEKYNMASSCRWRAE